MLGPKHRLLKGDVLAFLAEGGAAPADEPFEGVPARFHSLSVDATPLLRAARSSPLAHLRDVAASAVAAALIRAPKVNAHFNRISGGAQEQSVDQIKLVRESPWGVSSMLLPVGPKTSAALVAKTFRDVPASALARNVFELRDYIGSGAGDLPTPYLDEGRTVVLSVRLEEVAGQSTLSGTADIFDELVGPSASSAPKPADAAADALDKLTGAATSNSRPSPLSGADAVFDGLTAEPALPAHAQLVFELTVDSRAVAAKNADQFLRELQTQLASQA
ncbi:hypothetical protein HK105_208564 [Polyrhizophydium stewartii]|uniref:Uncharacterized protein n=1 Tax=Polyrhizophydium stewartii TaxID=2732419 RepID=A0ABR4MXH4_9FUNG